MYDPFIRYEHSLWPAIEEMEKAEQVRFKTRMEEIQKEKSRRYARLVAMGEIEEKRALEECTREVFSQIAREFRLTYRRIDYR